MSYTRKEIINLYSGRYSEPQTMAKASSKPVPKHLAENTTQNEDDLRRVAIETIREIAAKGRFDPTIIPEYNKLLSTSKSKNEGLIDLYSERKFKP